MAFHNLDSSNQACFQTVEGRYGSGICFPVPFKKRGYVGPKATYGHNRFVVLNLLLSCFRTSVPSYVLMKERDKGVYVVMPEGRLDSNIYLMFEEKVTPLFVASTKVLIFDLSRLDYMSSVGVRVILKAKKALKEISSSFMMANLKPQIKKVFDILNALPDIRVFKSIKEMDAYLDAMQKKEIQKQEEPSPP